MNRIIIKQNIWLDAANEPNPEMYREFENILYAALNSADMDTLIAVMEGREFTHFEVKIWNTFRMVEVYPNVKLYPNRLRNYGVILKIQED